MTLTRTIRRREKRKRAKARAAEELRRWNALSPERRETIESMNRMLFGMAIRTIENNLTFVKFVTREYK